MPLEDPQEVFVANKDIQAAQAYHEATKLTYINLRTKPPLFKSYAGLPVLPLPTDFPHPEVSTLDAVADVPREGGPSLDLTTLAQLLFFSAGLVRKRVFPGSGEVHFRASASTGALYPVEVYLVCRNIRDLEAGLYHFSPRDFALHQLRKGDYRGELSRAAGGDLAISASAVTPIFTAVFRRSAWKYRARSYRYCFWDNGTMVANTLATASAAGLPTCVLGAFVDDSVNRLLGISGEREASLCLIPVGEADDTQAIAPSLDVAPLSAEVVDSSGEEVDYHEVRHMHASSALTNQEDVTAWRGVSESAPPQQGRSLYSPQPLVEKGEVSGKLGEAILARGSTRRFSPVPVPSSHLSAILDRSTRGVPADFLGPGGESLLDTYVIVNAVQGFQSGSYFFSPCQKRMELLVHGDFRTEAGHLCFEQALGADASAVVFLMADLARVLGLYGNRGYRAAQLEAGIVGGKMYLCAYSLGLGASGLTFYDDDVTAFFSPHAQGESPMFVVALGIQAERNVVRPFRSRVGVMLDALSRGAKKGGGDTVS